MSIAPGHQVPTKAALGPKGAPFARDEPITAEFDLGPGAVQVTAAALLRLQPGDRIIIHAAGELGLGPGGAHNMARDVVRALKLDELEFDVPVVVAAPGLRIEVLRP